MPLSQLFGRIAFVGAILIMARALPWWRTGQWWDAGPVGRKYSLLFGAAIALGTLHSVITISERGQLFASIASLLLVVAAFLQRGQVKAG
jgi:hypothetical protein